VRLFEERDRDVVRPRLERNARGEARVHGITGRRRVVARRRNLLVAPERREVHALPIDANLELMRVLEPAHRSEIRPEQLHLELIVAVERCHVMNQDPADRSKWETFDVLVLRGVLPDAEDFARRRRVRIAQRERADPLCGRQITFEEHR
jgi:hypothetical protein